MNKTISPLIITTITALLLSACSIGNRIAQHGKHVSTTLGNITVNANNTAGELSTTNGNVTLGRNASTHDIEVINGNIELNGLNQVQSLETVNGNIEVGQKSNVDGDIETINGNIDISANTQISGNISTVNGNIILAKNTKITGNIVFEKRSSWIAKLDIEQPELVIAEGVEISGVIHLYQAVKLELSNKALFEKVIYHYKEPI